MNTFLTDSVLQAAGEPGFWKSLCPELTITEDPLSDAGSAYPFDLHKVEASVRQVIKEGYFQTPSVIPEADIEKLTNCILKVTGEGFPPPFAIVYDEFWKLFGRLSNVLSPVLESDYQILAEIWVYVVEKGAHAQGWLPHRDYEFRKDVLRPDGRPTIATVWFPLTDATTLNSCIYVLPTNLGPNCPGHLKKTTIDSSLLPSVRALPAKAGSIIGWNQHLIHWGARSSEWAAEPRISLAMYFQSRDVAPYVDNLTVDLSSPVPFDYRLGVIGRLIRKYSKTKLAEMPHFSDSLLRFCKKYKNLIGSKEEDMTQKIRRALW